MVEGAEQNFRNQTIAHYRIIRRLGIGGMGEVFLAEDTKLGRSAALKVIRPEAASNAEHRKRFLREARAAAVLNHSGIAVIYEIGEQDGVDFIAMEYVEGKTLSRFIEDGPMETNRIIRWGLELAGALAEAHRRGILHRDLKPENIQIGPQEHPKILDFGLAKFMEPTPGDQATEHEDALLGTIPYMSPEQVEGKTLDARSDLFSLGSILYEMATGKAPFTGDRPLETLQNIHRRNPTSIAELNPRISPGLCHVIGKCLQKNPDRRYGSAEELEADMKALQQGDTIDLQKPSRSPWEELSIAVLYFENLSEEQENEYFRAGMTEDIITELSKIRSWQVRPRTQVVRYKDHSVDLRKVGAELGVTHVLQGSIRKAGSRLRVSTQLVDAETAASIWGERYDRDIRDIFQIQSEIAQRIAAALQVHLTKREESEIGRRPTDNLQAYDCYLQGRERIFRLSRDDVSAAIGHFQQAVNIDPGFALPHAGLAQAYGIQLSFYGGSDSLADLALDTARRALALDPGLAQAYAALGLAYFLKGMGQEAVEVCARAIDLNPHDAFAIWISGRLLYRMNHYTESIERFQRTIYLFPDFYTAYSDLTQAYANLGMQDVAREMRKKTVEACRRYLEHSPRESRARIFLANSLAWLGQRDDALAEGKAAIELNPQDPVMMYNLACLYSILNEPEPAIDWLTKSVRQGRRDSEWIRRDPSFSNLRDHARFVELIAEIEKR
jgi:non-specific serine/threonine protein kinase